MTGSAATKIVLALVVLLAIGGAFWALQKIPLPMPIMTPGNDATPGTVMPPSPDGTTPSAATPGSAKPIDKNLIPLAAIKDCLGKAGESGTCLDKMFRPYLEMHTTQQALAIVQQYEDTDTTIRLSCHPVVHAIGRETFRKEKTVHDSFGACDQTCHSGCYHGAMERFLRGDAADDDTAAHVNDEELLERTRTACDPNQAVRFRFQCLHGLGHALMFFLDYQLEKTLAACDRTGDAWSRSSCYGGVFMENVFTATPEKRDLSPTNYHYPCNKLDEKYQPDCYMMQTTRMTEMGLATEKLFAECRKAGDYWPTCIQSIGRDLSNDARVGDPRGVAQKCEYGKDAGERQACIRGVSYALLDNTWDGRYGFPFCVVLKNPDDTKYCFDISEAYLRNTFERTVEAMTADCNKYVPAANQALCIDAVTP